MRGEKRFVLWIDDERYALTNYKALLERSGFSVMCAYSLSEGRKLMESYGSEADLVVLDVMMPLGEPSDVPLTDLELAKGGYEAGVVLARWIRERFPQVRMVAYSAFTDADVPTWLESLGIAYIPKTTHFGSADDFVQMIRQAIEAPPTRPSAPSLRAFIVHGHDAAAKWELKNYLQNILGLPEPRVLHEQPSQGRTVIEKFEEEAADRNVIFVLLTPDDPATPASGGAGAATARARQNVVFELGYFMGRLGRRQGRVLILYKQGVELPSDLAGVVYLDITSGVSAVGEAIRREIQGLI